MSGKKTWPGGYIRWGKKGPTYIIERWRDGVRFHVSTKCRDEGSALKELVRFNEDPLNYVPSSSLRAQEPKRKPLIISPELVIAYRDWMLTREKPASREWALACANFLADWAEDLNRKDIRDVSVQRDLKPALEARRTSRKHRIEAIKAFCSWLRREKGLLRHAEDPTLDLAVPQSAPERHKRKKVVERERVFKVLPFIREDVRDMLILQMGTAWHVSEIRRFAERGEIVPDKTGKYLAVLRVLHKSGDYTRSPIQHREHLEAAERIRARGKAPGRHAVADAMDAACLAAKVPHFGLGVMRHTVLTWAVELGANPRDVAEFANHRSERTTRKFYIDTALPTVAIPVLSVIDGGKKTG